MPDLWGTICEDQTAPSYHHGTYRAASPAETLRRIRPLARLAGITRLADITGLDAIGIPVAQAIRPNSRNMSLSNGKGLTRDQARVSALMESLESYHAERLPQPLLRGTVASMQPRLSYEVASLATVQTTRGCARRHVDYDPLAPPIGTPSFLNPGLLIEWIPATDLATGACSWVPRQLCDLDFSVGQRLCLPVFRATSNGLASGNTYTEALIHGLCEVVERDCLCREASAWKDPCRWLVPATIESIPAERILRRFARAKLKTQIVDLTGPTDLPCFGVAISDGERLPYRGYGCHPSRETALLRALTEAAQSRLGHIAGAREDMYRETYRNGSCLWADKDPAYSEPGRRAFSSCADQPITDWPACLADIVERIHSLTGAAPLAVDLWQAEFDIPVVFVIAPGLLFRPPCRS